MRPAPDAPTWSPIRATVMSTRPADGIDLRREGRRRRALPHEVPSCTVRTRTTAGLYVIVSDIVDTRDALLIDTGTSTARRRSGTRDPPA